VNEQTTPEAAQGQPNTISLDLSDLDLTQLTELEGSALESIIKEFDAKAQEGAHSRHSSHSSYATHGTHAW
jgi:hypothetical protein